MYAETEVIQESSDRHFVIPEYVVNTLAVFYQVIQRGKWGEVVFGKDEIIFEPEFEQIAEDIEVGQP
jgi:hypothetical protein